MHADRLHFCIPLKTKNAEEIVDTYLKYVVCTLGASRKILSDNSTEFKNKLFDEVAEKLGIERKYTLHHTGHKQMAESKVSINT